MGEVTIRLDDARLLKTLEDMASVHGTTIEAEARSAIENAAVEHQRRLELVRRSREIRAMTPKGARQTDSVEIIRQMREERDRELGS